MPDDDEHHTVYRQDSVLTIGDVERELRSKRTLTKKQARDDVKAGGLFCSHGSEMTFVISEHRKNHFRHVAAPTARPSNNHGGNATTACGCSSRHLDAQALLRDHDYAKHPVAFTEWRDCKKPECCKTVYMATATGAALDVRLEVREQQGKFVSDVVYYEGNEACMRVEVYATHKADRDRRAGTEFVEVSAQHVVESFKGAIGTIVLRCEGSCTGRYEACVPCAERQRAKRAEAEARRQRAAEERVRKEERLRQWRVAEAERKRVAEEVRRQREAEAAERKRVAEEVRRQREAEAAERQRAEEQREREAERLRREAWHQRTVAEHDRIVALDNARAAREAERAEVAKTMEVAPMPQFSVIMGTDAPKVSQEETERRRAERMARQAVAAAAKRARRRR